jgi:hypothetical protein
LTSFAVAPAIARERVGPPAAAHADQSACPHERARLAAAAAAWKAQEARKGPTRVTVVGGAPSERALRNVAPGAYFNP